MVLPLLYTDHVYPSASGDVGASLEDEEGDVDPCLSRSCGYDISRNAK